MTADEITRVRSKLKEIQALLLAPGSCEQWPQVPLLGVPFCVGCQIGIITQQIEMDFNEAAAAGVDDA